MSEEVSISVEESSSEATTEISPEQLTEIRQLAKEDLFFFAKGILGYDWFNKRIHGPLCRILEDEQKLLVVGILPRGWQKSTLVSICFPLWLAINDPNETILLVQNTATNADAKLNVIKATIEGNALFRTLFPELLPTEKCTWRSGALELNRTRKTPEATFESIGVGGSVIGRHYGIVIEDDTVAPDADDMSSTIAMPSMDDIEKAIGFHNSMTSILIDIQKSRNIVIGTRWAQRDLLSHIVSTMGEDVYLYQRAVREDVRGDACETGEITFPERFNEDTLRILAKRWGPYMFSCLYMNKPIRSEDMVFKEDNIQFYETEPLSLAIYTSVDSANDPEDSKTTDPDYCVVLTTGKCLRTGFIYVLDYVRERCTPGRLIDAIFEAHRRWKPLKIVIEGVQYQKSIAYWCRERMRKNNQYFEIELITHGGKSKSLRIMGLQPLFAAHVIFLRRWMTELINELFSFPIGAHDDLIDALAMQLDVWATTRVEKPSEQPLDEHPLSFERGARELRERNTKKSGHFGDYLEHRDFSPLESLMSYVQDN